MMRMLCLLALALVVTGCRGQNPVPAGGFSPPSQAEQPKAQPVEAPSPQRSQAGEPRAQVLVTLETDKGAIELELNPSAAPKTVESFVKLVKEGFYDGMPFHRVEPGFVIQAGDPALVGKPPVGFTIPDEASPVKHVRGVIAMARIYRGGQMVPNSASSQFYITLSDAPHLDQMGFTAFGHVVKGMEVADRIAVGDKILTARVVG
jgi:peptidyl-prolyl cis-trans isomerase B (cyclophilin B)